MTHINQRRDTAANWTSTNPVLQLGEMGWETDTLKGKLGDGATPWTGLSYIKTTATKADVGLANVDNTSDLSKPISTAAQAALNSKADLASPAFTGNPTAPTPTAGDNDTSIATTAFVQAVAALLAPISSPALTGNPTAPTPSPGDNDTSIATTAFVTAAIAALVPSSWDGANSRGTILIGSLRVNFGTAAVSMAGGASASGSVTFAAPFSAAPYVATVSLLTFVANKLVPGLNQTAGAPTMTTLNWAVKTGDGTTSSATPTLYYIAVGPA